MWPPTCYEYELGGLLTKVFAPIIQMKLVITHHFHNIE